MRIFSRNVLFMLFAFAFQFPFLSFSQVSISRIEYYIDSDPGYGNGTPLSFTPGTDIQNAIIPVDPSSLSEGVHRLEVRACNANGAWSLNNSWLFYKPYGTINPPPVLSPVSAITRLEYYIDEDPGYGNATALNITAATDLQNLIIPVNPSPLSEGVHRLEVRACNANGAWSLNNSWLFYKPYGSINTPPALSPVSAITRLEYYIDEDPGYGNATALNITAATDLQNLIIPVNPSPLSEGVHRLEVRACNANGAWSLNNSWLFYKPYGSINTPPALSAVSNITRLEYFIDIDPGYGNGTAVAFTPDTNLSNLIVPVNLTGVNAGNHVLSLRSRNANGNWSLCNKIDFNIPIALPQYCGFRINATSTNATFNGGSNGSISVSVIDTSRNCTSQWSVYLYDSNNAQVNLSGCSGGFWRTSCGSTFTKTGLTAGTYKLIGNNTCGCSDTVVVVISQPALLPCSFKLTGQYVNPVCNGASNGSIQVQVVDTTNNCGGTWNMTVSGGAYYNTWSSTSGTTATFSNLAAGNYTITGVNACQCRDTIVVQLTNPLAVPIPAITNAGPDTVCRGNSITLSSVPANNIQWSDGSTTPQITVNASGTYRVTYTDAQGCTAISAPKNVYVDQFQLTGTAAVCQNEPVTLTASGSSSQIWSTGQTSRQITVQPAVTTTYFVTATTPLGCTYTDSLTLVINPVSMPGPVSNMQPANNATGLSLPLNLNWQPGIYNTMYDLYVWIDTIAQPSTPFLSNLTTISVSITNLTYGYRYNWRVVSKNGNCYTASGPVQSFTLRQLPDLVVDSVNVPISVFSGTTLSISWRTSNIGLGSTVAQQWSDAVYLSTDTILTPGIDTYLGAKPNPSALLPGQSYASTLNAVLPNGIAGNYYIIVIARQFGSLIEQSSTNNRRLSQVFQISLSPTPDLRVESIIHPATAFSSNSFPCTPSNPHSVYNTISLTYTVKNYGTIGTGLRGWTDKIYISDSPFLNVNTTPVAYTSEMDSLQPDSTYSKNIELPIPAYLSGSLYIYVFTDQTNTLYEGPFENNNINSSVIQVFLTAPPDLDVDSINGPLVVSSGDRISIDYTISNIGSSTTDADRIDSLYLSTDSSNFRIGQFYGLGGRTNLMMHFPCQMVDCGGDERGYRYFYRFMYNSNLLSTYRELSAHYGDYFNFFYNIYLDACVNGTPSQNLYNLNDIITSINDRLRLLYGNTSYYTSLRVSSPYHDWRYNYEWQGYLSQFSQTAIINGWNNIIASGQSKSFTQSVTIPDSASGVNYLYVVADATNNLFEFTYKQNNTGRSANSILVLNPDLSIDSVFASTNASSGQNISISWNIRNNGPGNVSNRSRKDLIYLSPSATFNASTAILIDSLSSAETISNGNKVVKQRTFTIPNGLSGVYYVFVMADGRFNIFESNETNNRSLVPAVVNISLSPYADLVKTTFQVHDTLYRDYPVEIKYTISNNGNAPVVASWKDSLFISSSPVWNRQNAAFLSMSNESRSLQPGASYDRVIQTTVLSRNPLGADQDSMTYYYYVILDSDNQIFEHTGENNNIIRSNGFYSINNKVNHIVTNVQCSSTLTGSTTSQITWTVKNLGGKANANRYSSWTDALIFSTDTLCGNSDDIIRLSYPVSSPLDSNQTYTSTRSFIVPNNLNGNYYVFIETNKSRSIPAEIIVNDNYNLVRNTGGQPLAIAISSTPAPDLVVTAFDFPTIVQAGQPVTVTYTIKNNGPGNTVPGSWMHGFYISTNLTTAGSLLSFSASSGPLTPGSEYTDSATLTIPMNYSGNYFLSILVDDQNRVFESDDNNNARSGSISIFQAPPCDLTVSDIVTVDSVLAGDSIHVDWILHNIGTSQAQGSLTQGIYFSRDTIWDSGDVLMRSISSRVNIPPGGQSNQSDIFPVLNAALGYHYVIVRSDLLNNLNETNESNNDQILFNPVYVNVKNLPLNVLVPDVLRGRRPLYYRIEIPDTLNSETLLVTLKGDSMNATNEMYVRLGQLPSQSTYDAGYTEPLSGNQEILVPDIVEGTYYVMVYSSNYYQQITLKAEILPFAIRSVNSRKGGNTGTVTVQLIGSRFEPGMTATLTPVGGGAAITAPRVDYVNSTKAFARFDLRGKSLGMYDVTLTKPLAQTQAVLNSGFEIEAGNSGGFYIGGISNTGQTGDPNAPGCNPGAAAGVNQQLQVSVNAPSQVRFQSRFPTSILFGNAGNVDIPIPSRLIISLDIPISFSSSTINEYELFTEFREANGPTDVLRAGATGSITFYNNAIPPSRTQRVARFIIQ